MRPCTVLVALSSLCGCYGWHGLPDSEARDGSSGVRDGGVVVDARDGDADVLPVEPEPDPDPDERPTGPWEDVPPPPPGSDALEAVGEPIAVDDELDGGGPPVTVWDGSGWGVAWPGVFRVLDADGHPLSPLQRLRGRGSELGIDFAIGRYAFATAGGETGPGQLAAFDRRGTLATAWEDGFGIGPVDIARLQIAHQWVVATELPHGAGVGVYMVDNAMRPASDVIAFHAERVYDLRIAGLVSRALVAWSVPDGLIAQTLRGAPLTTDGEPFSAMTVGQISDSGFDAETFRDLVGLVATNGEDVVLALVDAWEHEVVVGPVVIGQSRILDRRPGLATAPEHGFLVACWAHGPGPAGGGAGHGDGITLQVVGADGTLFGAPLAMLENQLNLGGIDCGWNGREVVVIWWRAGGDRAFNTIYSQRVRPTFL